MCLKRFSHAMPGYTSDVDIPFLPVSVRRYAASFAFCSSPTLRHMPLVCDYNALACSKQRNILQSLFTYLVSTSVFNCCNL